MVEERACKGWMEFCDMTGMSMSKAMCYRKSLEDAGAIYYLLEGRPAAKRMYFFPSIVKRWLGLMTKNGKVI